MLAGVLVAVAVASGAFWFMSDSRLNQTLPVSTELIPVPTDISAIQRGQHLAGAIALCNGCHAANMAGRLIMDDAVARIVAPNLTAGHGGFGASFSDADFVRAIRRGIDPRGRQLLVMPSDNYSRLSDADVGAIVAYLRSLPAIDTNLPSSEVRPLGRLLLVTGQITLLPGGNADPSLPRRGPTQLGLTPEYGQYLVDIAGCATCHGPGLSGGSMPGATRNAVPAANITPTALKDWSEADFLRVMRTGRRPDDRMLDASMPWQYYAQMTDLELRAVWRFLQLVPPRTTGTH